VTIPLPRVFRTTPFRLTLLFLTVFAAAASIFLGYIYGVTAGEVTSRADRAIDQEIQSLTGVYHQGGIKALNQSMVERSAGDRPFLYLLLDRAGQKVTGTIEASPIARFTGSQASVDFKVTDTNSDGGEVRHSARGQQVRLEGGEILFVGADVSEAESFVLKILRAIWGAGALVILLGLAGGVLISRNVNETMAGLNRVVTAVRGGDIAARAKLRGVKDEFDELAAGLNDMLDRLEHSMGGLRHVGDAIAHDLRSPLSRLRARLELALIEAEAGKGNAKAALVQALEDAEGVLSTFNAVLAITRLQSAVEAPDQIRFDPGQLAAGVADLYEPLCEDKAIAFRLEATPALTVRGNREVIAQALANILDNAVKYTPQGGAVRLRVRRRASGEVEFSVTDTGPGVPQADRARVVQRFVRLEQSRSQPGAGLGLSLVAAVAEAHGGRLELDDGPGTFEGTFEGSGPGLRVALVLPRLA
jgi:signal transduction histidine kinase